jgi:hypothetical protein
MEALSLDLRRTTQLDQMRLLHPGLDLQRRGHPCHQPKSVIPSLSLTSGNHPGNSPVQQLNFNESHKYLGNHLMTGMHMNDAHGALQTTASSYGSRLLSSPLSKRDAWIAYFAVFIPSMAYTLAVSHHPPKHLKKVQSAASRATLMKLGFNRNTPSWVVFGPSRYGGLGFRDWPSNRASAKLNCWFHTSELNRRREH